MANGNIWNPHTRLYEAIEDDRKFKHNGVLANVSHRTFKCIRCDGTYELIEGDVVGCCTNPVQYRTSGICGGELKEID